MYRVFELSGKPSRLSLRKQWISPPLKAPLKWFATVTECASPAVFRYARESRYYSFLLSNAFFYLKALLLYRKFSRNLPLFAL